MKRKKVDEPLPEESSDYDSSDSEDEVMNADQINFETDESISIMSPGSRKQEIPIPPYLKQFARPPLPEGLDQGDISFNNVDISYDVVGYDERFASRKICAEQTQNAVITVYGLVKAKDSDAIASNSICVHIHGFNPYFLAEVTDQEMIDKINNKKYWKARGLQELEDIRIGLNGMLNPSWSKEVDVLKVEVLMKKSILGFRKHTTPFFKIYMADPRKVSKLRDLIQPKNAFQKSPFPYSNATYESNIPYVTRYMVNVSVF